MNQQTKVSVVSGLVMISLIILLTYYGYPSKRTDKRPEKNTYGLNQHSINVKIHSSTGEAEATPDYLKTNNKNEDLSFNVFGPKVKIEVPEKSNMHLRVYDTDLASN